MKLFYKFILPLALFLFACLIAFGENGPTPKVVVGSSGISDGSVTPAKINSGYNLLTDAEKTQALVGSATVDHTAKNYTAAGFSTLGELGTGIKMKYITDTTAAAEGGGTTMAHGLAGAKIISVTMLVRLAVNDAIGPAYTRSPEYEYMWKFDATNIFCVLSETNSGNILNKPIACVVLYVE